jgi:hypothetical protein
VVPPLPGIFDRQYFFECKRPEKHLLFSQGLRCKKEGGFALGHTVCGVVSLITRLGGGSAPDRAQPASSTVSSGFPIRHPTGETAALPFETIKEENIQSPLLLREEHLLRALKLMQLSMNHGPIQFASTGALNQVNRSNLGDSIPPFACPRMRPSPHVHRGTRPTISSSPRITRLNSSPGSLLPP